MEMEMEMDIPLGFELRLTDQMAVEYLLRRVMGLQIPRNIIGERNIYGENASPSSVFSDMDDANNRGYWISKDQEEMKKTVYVFTKLVKAGPKRIARRAGSGTWGGQNIKDIKKVCSGEIVGLVKMFTYKDSKEKKGDQHYHWIMHEYSLIEDGKNIPIDNDVVLCKITRIFKGVNKKNKNIPVPADRRIIVAPSSSTTDGSYESIYGSSSQQPNNIPQLRDVENNEEDAGLWLSTSLSSSPLPLSGQKRSLMDINDLQGSVEEQLLVNNKKARLTDDDFSSQGLDDIVEFNFEGIDDDLFRGLLEAS